MKPATHGQAGYTIVEVMIFLIVSSAMLLSAMSLFGGKIQRTEFAQSVQALDSRIKSVANEASTATYQGNIPFDCNTSRAVYTSSLGATGQQGTRSDCIFVGKIIAPASSCTRPIATSKCTKIDVYTVIGRRIDPNTGKVSSALTGATGSKPQLVLDPDLTQTIDLTYNTQITGIWQNTAFPALVSGLGFFQTFNGTYNNGNLTSGAQNIEAWNIRTLTVNPVTPLSKQQMATAVSSENMAHPLASPMVVCLSSGNGGQTAKITVGGASSAVATTVAIGVACP